MKFMSFFKKPVRDIFKNEVCSLNDHMDKIEMDIIICPEGKGKTRVYSIYSVQVPNVVTQGKSIEEAKIRLREALKLYLEDLPKEELISYCEVNNAPMISRMFL